MSSSFILSERKKVKQYYIGNPHYIKPFGNCHPEWLTIPIGNDTKEPVKICIEIPKRKPEIPKKPKTGVYKMQNNPYNPEKKNPCYFNRESPDQNFFLQNEYFRLPVLFNGTGIINEHKYFRG